MTSLAQRRLDATSLAALVRECDDRVVTLTNVHRASLAARFRAVGGVERRRLDAWTVEAAGAPSAPFVWTPVRAKRAIGRGALRRVRHNDTVTVTVAVSDEIDELFVRAAAGYARAGSLAHWLSGQPAVTVAVASVEAITWATNALEVLEPLPRPWEVCAADAFYDVAAARTTLRGHRDVVVHNDHGRVLLRLRSGQPGHSAGPGLRADLVVDALSHPEGQIAQRIVGLWPDAGVALSVDGSIEDARAGARDLVRTAVAQQRFSRKKVA